MRVTVPAEALASAHVAPADLAFFARHPDRRYRARRPFRSELQSLGKLPPLNRGQARVVIVSRLGAGHIMTGLYAVRLGPRGRFPDTDMEIHETFTRRVPAA